MTDIEKLKRENYPVLKKAAQRSARCYRDDLLRVVDDALENDEATVTIPVGMAHELVHVCNFVDRLDAHGK